MCLVGVVNMRWVWLVGGIMDYRAQEISGWRRGEIAQSVKWIL